MTLGVEIGSVSYTVQEVRDLRAAIMMYLDVNPQTQTKDPILVEAQLQSHMIAGHKASDL